MNRGRGKKEGEVTMLNFQTEQRVKLPVTRGQALAEFKEVLDSGELRAVDKKRIRQPDKSYRVEKRTRSLYKVKPDQ